MRWRRHVSAPSLQENRRKTNHRETGKHKVSCEEPTEEELCAELAALREELAGLLLMPTRFTLHGQTIDNSDRIAWLKRRVAEIGNRLAGRSIFQGPDLVQ